MRAALINLWNEFCLLIMGNIKFIIPISIGMAGKWAIDRHKRYSKIQWIAKMVIAVFCGYTAHRYLMAHDMMYKAGYIVPMVTVAGEGVVQWFIKHGDRILRWAVKSSSGMKDEDIDSKQQPN